MWIPVVEAKIEPNLQATISPLPSLCIYSTPPVPSIVDSDIDFAERFAPWFIEADSVEANSKFEPEGLINSNAIYNTQQPWDFPQDLTFIVSDVIHQDVTRRSDLWLNTPLEQVSRNSPERYNLNFINSSEAVVFSTLKLNQDERNTPIENAMPTNQLFMEEENSALDDDVPSPKRRKASPSISANRSPSDSFRAGPNASEKRYRSKARNI